MKRLLIIAMTLSLGACQTVSWQRFDGKQSATAELNQAKYICQSTAEATAATSTAYLTGVAGGLAAANVQIASMKACMAERGYMLANAN